LLKIAIAGRAIKRQGQRVDSGWEKAPIAGRDVDGRRIVLRASQRGDCRQHNHRQHESKDHTETS